MYCFSELSADDSKDKTHWSEISFFRSNIKEGVLRTVRCDSAENTADIFTKGLQGQAFVDKRKLLCGW